MFISGQHLRIARVLYEDDELMTMEVIKNEDRLLTVEDGDTFLQVVFIRNLPDGTGAIYVPWGDTD